MELITKADFIAFKVELMQELKSLIGKNSGNRSTEWLRSAQVRKMLHISPGTLQQLRINGVIKFSKIGSLHFYKLSDIEEMLNKKNNSDGKCE